MSFRKIITVIIVVVLLVSSTVVYANTNSYDGQEYLATSPLLNETMELLSNRHVHPFNTKEVKSVLDIENFDKIAESEKVALYFNREGDTLRLLNKKTGYVWGALPLTDARNLNKSWSDYGASIIGITCFDKKNMSKRYGLKYNATTKYTFVDNGLIGEANFTDLKIKLNFSVTLYNDHVTFSVDANSVVEEGEYKLGTVAFMPYLGSCFENELDGYIFIPDGCGALMRFNEPRSYVANYSKRVYGKDLALDLLTDPIDLNCFRPNDYILSEKQVVMPVYGIVHGAYQNGLFAVIEDGEEYASITANPAVTNNRYNRIHAEFIFRQSYNKNVNRKEGAGIVIPQEFINKVNPKLTIYVTDNENANYDGMAVMYRDYLTQQGILNGSVDNGDISLRLEILGADKQKTIFGFKPKLFTSFGEAVTIVDRLNSYGIDNIDLTFKHYTFNDEAGNRLSSNLGGINGLNQLKEKVNANGNFYLYIDPNSANSDQINLRTEAANNLATSPFRYERDNYYIIYPSTYFFRMNFVENRINNAISSKYGKNTQFTVDYLCNTLYGDFTTGKEHERSQNLETTIRLIEKLANGEKLPMINPNLYALKYADAFYDIAVTSSQFLYESDSVPFLQIVLNGKMKTFGGMLNVGTYSKEMLLKYVEYGVFPSFVTTNCDTLSLADTPEEDLISTSFDDWENKITYAYSFINDALSKVSGSCITSHRAINEGLIEIIYQNGVKIYVNYSNKEVVVDNKVVNASSYLVVE